MADRMRIPWFGGAKQIAIDAVLPIIILPCFMLLATISLWWTVFTFCTMVVFLYVVFQFLIRTMPKTTFFYSWAMTSIGMLYLQFQFIVVPLLEILIEENISLSVLIALLLVSMYRMKMKTTKLGKVNAKQLEKELVNSEKSVGYSVCKICDIKVPDKDHHCIWFNTCVGIHNQLLFISTLIFATAALVYSSNLTLTSVCHPFVFYKQILLPDDCSEVYEEFELAISFVMAIYSIILAVLILGLLLHQFLIISIGLTTRDWKKLPTLYQCLLGFPARRQNRGFLTNWYRVLCSKDPYVGNRT